MRELLRLAQDRYVRPSILAEAYTLLGDRDAAFQWSDKAYSSQNHLLRRDPRFTSLLARVGLE